jgi:hypothetical protein
MYGLGCSGEPTMYGCARQPKAARKGLRGDP